MLANWPIPYDLCVHIYLRSVDAFLAYCLNSVLNVKVVKGIRGILRDYEPSDGPF